jgi:hypothetical protein
MVERTTADKKGRVRSATVERVTVENVKPLLKKHLSEAANLQTDEHTVCYLMKKDFLRHDTVNHKNKEYVRKEADGKVVTTNTVECFFSLIKRGVHGIYHHWSRKYIGMYLSEFASAITAVRRRTVSA